MLLSGSKFGKYRMFEPEYKYPKAFCTDEDIQVAKGIREYVDKEIIPDRPNLEGGWHKDEQLARDTAERHYAQLVKMGLQRLNMPVEYGGLGLSPVARGMIQLELARGEIPLAVLTGKVQWAVSFALAAKRNDLLEEMAPQVVGDEPYTACVVMTEPAGGANIEDPVFDFRTMRTRATFEGDDIVINGHKMWPGPSGPADYFKSKYLKGIMGYWTVAQTDPAKGADGVRMIQVPPDAKGLSFSKPYQKMGFAYSERNCEIWFEDVRVPKRYIVDTEPGMAARMIKANFIGAAKLISGLRLAGACEAILEIALNWTGNREIAGVPVRERSYFASILAEMFRLTEVSRTYALSVAWELGHPEIYGEPWSPEMMGKCALARSFAADAADFCAERGMELLGSYGYSYDYHIEKIMRDIKIVKIWLGGAQRDRLDIAQALYGPFKWSGMDEWIRQGGLVTEGFGGPRY